MAQHSRANQHTATNLDLRMVPFPVVPSQPRTIHQVLDVSGASAALIMQLDLLALKAKRSISQLLARNRGTENAPSSIGYNQIEKGTTNFRTPDPSPHKVSVESNANDSPPSDENLSRRKGLMGSLGTNKLRSINSFRSLRSPTKTRQPDTATASCANSPRAPTHCQKSSLVLNFQESPADEPIFDLRCEDSIDVSQKIYYSSPMPIPSSENHRPQSFTACSAIPDGTIPSSPAPIRKVLELEQAEGFPSPTFSPADDLEIVCMDFLAPIQDIQELDQIEDPLLETPEMAQADTEPYHNSVQGPRSELLSAENVVELINGNQHMQQESVIEKFAEQFDRHGLDARKSKTSTSENLLIITKEYLFRIFHYGDFKTRVGITAYGADDRVPNNGSEVILARRDEDFAAAEKIMPDIGKFIMLHKDLFGKAETELVLDEALARGLLPEWLDLNLDMKSSAKFRSRTINSAKTQKRESTWGQHAGLYDGTGYGAGSSTRSSTATENATDAVCRRIENGESEQESDKMPPSAYKETARFCSAPDWLPQRTSIDTAKVNTE